MNTPALKVGELAARTGVSVRTLHHYDEIGLLRPSRRSESGHRLYGPADVQRLLRIRALVQLQFSLEQIAACLRQQDISPERLLLAQITNVRERIEQAERLQQRLESLLAHVQRHEEPSVGELLTTIEELTMFEKYYTQEQMQQLAARRAKLGDDAIRAVEAEWPRLVAAVRQEMDRGTDPTAPAVQQLARRWRELLAMFTGGDEGIRKAAAKLNSHEQKAQALHGIDAELFRYIGRALAD